jgi:hypothetical protein
MAGTDQRYIIPFANTSWSFVAKISFFRGLKFFFDPIKPTVIDIEYRIVAKDARD